MSAHTTFQVGGPADLYALPQTPEDVAVLLSSARELHVPYFILGGGANILVSDHGVRGLVIDMKRFDRLELKTDEAVAGAGLPVSRAAESTARRRLAGLEFLYAMPGSVGGAIWMNARCYGGEIAQVLSSVITVDPSGTIDHYQLDPNDWSYKRSPFQTNGLVVIEARFSLAPGDPATLRARMKEIESDRRAKGHFAAPSAGSVFKNDRALGKPTGALLDGLGVRGLRMGNAMVSEYHANIVVNGGGATATQIREVIETLHARARTELGIELEREVLFVGDWR